MKAIPVDQCNSSPAPKEFESIPAILSAKPKCNNKTGFVETSLQKLDDYPESVILVQWSGAKNGRWYPASEVFRIIK